MTALEHDWFPRPLPQTVTLGERTWLYSSYALHHSHGQVRIGRDCGIYHGTFFELGPQGEVEIGCFCTLVGAIIRTNGRVVIGDHTFIAHEVVIADEPFSRPPTGEPEPSGTEVTIGSGAWIGARAVILGETHIGDYAVIGAGAVVSGDIPHGVTATGNPARWRPELT